jgi:PQQ-dependent dehydrogenase (methanol/ethanol family)
MMELYWIEEDAGLTGRAVSLATGTFGSLAALVRPSQPRCLVVWAFMAFILCFAAGDIEPAGAAGSAANVDATRITGADQDPANWMTYGRTYSEQRFSPLARITADTVKQLGLAWYADLDANRGQEATPLVIDGVLYVSTAWSMVKALDAKTGTLLWSYDPAVPRELGVRGCCDVVNRGVAAWKGKIFIGTFDGRLVALDAGTGKPVWSVMTVDPSKPYTITQAPRVIKGRVVIGNSGSEYGVRGYISAYDAETGNLAWRFYTVPGDPAQPAESPILAEAAKTWNGEWWKLGGGGTVWESLSYDPELNLIYLRRRYCGPRQRCRRFQRLSRGYWRETVVDVRAISSDGGADNLRGQWRAVYRRARRLGRSVSPDAGEAIRQVRQHAQRQPAAGVQARR